MHTNCRHISTVDAGCIPVTVLEMGIMQNNCLIVSDGREQGAPAMVVDPAGDAEAIQKALGWFDLKYIVCTHNHCDHVMALPQLAQATGAQVVVGAQDAALIESGQPGMFGDESVAPVKVGRKLSDGDVVELGSLKFQVIHTPGHTKGGVCLYMPEQNGKPGLLFAGDTLFRSATGRVDFEGGSASDMRESLKKLAKLPDSTIVFPGHESLTTIGTERHRVIEAF